MTKRDLINTYLASIGRTRVQGAYSAVMDVKHDPDCPCQKED